MRNRMTCLVAVAGILVLSAGLAQAAGFSIYEANSKATALGCAFTATADDGSAVFYNVAGLSFQTGQSVEANVVTIAPSFAFTGKLNKTDAAASYVAKDQIFAVPGVYYTNNPGENIAYGIGIYAPFGLGLAWEDGAEWVGRRVSHDASIQTIYITPAASYLITDQLAFGAGIDIAHQSLKLKRYTPHPNTGENAIETSIEGGSKFNITPVLGLMYRPNDKLSLGANFHFKKTMKYDEGDATLNPVPPGDDPFGNTLVANLGRDQKVSSDLNLPHMLQLGIAYRFAPKFRGEFNYVHFGWSTFEKLDLKFSNENLNQQIHFNYEDSWQIRFGFEYLASEKWNLMAGYVHDRTPQPLASVSPLLPDTDRNDYSFGALYKHKRWEFNASYMFVNNIERSNIENDEPVRNTTDYPFGTYRAHAHLVGVGATYRF